MRRWLPALPRVTRTFVAWVFAAPASVIRASAAQASAALIWVALASTTRASLTLASVTLASAALTWVALVPPAPALAAPAPFQRDLSIPPVIEDTGAAAQCTVAYLVADTTTNDTFLLRMRIAPAQITPAVRNRLPCPASIPPRLSVRALDACTVRVEDPNTCVHADMARGFEREPVGRNTSSAASRCQSDRADFIGLACVRRGALDVCSVACGMTEDEAKAQARARCEDKHQDACPITAAAPVLVPP